MDMTSLYDQFILFVEIIHEKCRSKSYIVVSHLYKWHFSPFWYIRNFMTAY